MAWEMETGSSGGAFEAAPAGNHPAVLVGLIDVGSQLVRGFQGGADSYKRQVVLIWEICGEVDSTGKPFVLARTFTRSLHEKAALRDWIERWRGKKYATGEKIDLSKLAGAACLLTVIHDENGDKVYARADGISAIPKGMPIPTATHKPIVWQVGDSANPPEDSWLPFVFGKKICDMIRSSPEFNGQQPPQQTRQHGNGQHAQPAHQPQAQPQPRQTQPAVSDGGTPF